MWTIEHWYRESKEFAARNAAMVRQGAELILQATMDHLPGVSRDEVVRRLHNLNRQRLAAVPSLTQYPELRGMGELVQADWRGVRDGAGLDDALWAAHCDQHYYSHRYISTGQAVPPGCSYVYFPTSDRGPMLAHNIDCGPIDFVPEPGWPAISEHLILGGVSSGVFLDEQSPEMFPAPVYKLVGRYCRNTDEAVEMLTRYNYFWGPGNVIVIDRNHDVAMIEKSACRIGVRRSPDGFGFITAMTAQEPSMKAFLQGRRTASILARKLPKENADAAYWKAQDRRHELMSELLDEARKNPTAECLRRFIQFRSPERGNVCANGEPVFPGGPPTEHTVRTDLWFLREGRAQWWAMEGKKPSFENRKPDMTFKDMWLWD